MDKTSQEYSLGSSKVTLTIGDILQSEASVIVSSDDNKLTMRGGVSKAILDAAGATILAQAARLATNLELGDVVPTTAGQLKSRHVFHAVTRLTGHRAIPTLSETQAVISKVVVKCVDLITAMDLQSIAFPAIGTGFAKHSPKDVAVAFAAILGSKLATAKAPLSIEVYVHPDSITGDLAFLNFFRVFDDESNWRHLLKRNHTVVLIHGIRDEARWQERVARVLNEADHEIYAVPIGFGYFDVVQFILPIGPIRRRMIKKVEDRILKLCTTPGTKKVSVIAHSFGTFLITSILARRPDIRLNCLILCGGIVSADFDWDRIEKQLVVIDREDYPTVRAINDCGWRDIWPVFAHSMTWGYGSTGRFGFKTEMVRDRFHDMSHSGFFSAEFVKKYWLTALSTNRIVESPHERPASSLVLLLLTVIQLKYVLGACAVVGLTWLAIG